VPLNRPGACRVVHQPQAANTVLHQVLDYPLCVKIWVARDVLALDASCRSLLLLVAAVKRVSPDHLASACRLPQAQPLPAGHDGIVGRRAGGSQAAAVGLSPMRSKIKGIERDRVVALASRSTCTTRRLVRPPMHRTWPESYCKPPSELRRRGARIPAPHRRAGHHAPTISRYPWISMKRVPQSVEPGCRPPPAPSLPLSRPIHGNTNRFVRPRDRSMNRVLARVA